MTTPMTTASTLPCIDISPFLLETSELTEKQKLCARALDDACVKFGFFLLSGCDSVISEDEFSHMLDVGRQFFQGASTAEKSSIAIKPGDGARGYQGLRVNVTEGKVDEQEAIDWYRPMPPEMTNPNKLIHGLNQWPSTPSDFRSTAEGYTEKMFVLGAALMRATAAALGLQPGSVEHNELINATRESFYYMRVIGYPTLPPDAQGVSCGTHKDYGCWTLLHADTSPGSLQIFVPSEDGRDRERGARGTWINADAPPGTIVCNIGEMWEVWTARRYQATLHRVIHQGKNYRVSVPFFFEPSYDAVVRPLPSLVRKAAEEATKKGQMLSGEVKYFDHLRRKVANNFTENFAKSPISPAEYEPFVNSPISPVARVV